MWLRLLIWVVVLVQMTACASASTDRKIKLCGTVWPPFTYANGNKMSSGISIDVLQEAFGRMHLSYEVKVLSWIWCRREVSAERMDALIDATPAETQIAGPNFSSLYPLAVFVLADSPFKSFDEAHLRGEQVGMVRGYLYGPIVSNMKGLKRVDAGSDEQLMIWLKLRRVDYIITDEFAGPILADRVGVKVRTLSPMIEVTPLYLSFNSHNAELAAQYNRVLGDMIADGTLDAIYRRYLPYSFHDALKRWLKQ